MPIAVVLALRSLGPSRLPVSHGSLVYAAALDLVLRRDPRLSRALHDAPDRKPLTVGLLDGPLQQEGDGVTLTAGTLYAWRLTGLTAPVAEVLRRLPASEGIRIGPAVFTLAGLATGPDEHPEAGQEDYAALWGRWASRTPPGALTLHFVTPTTFRVGRLEQPLPLPRWVFGSLLGTWNAFAPLPLDLDLAGLDERVAVANWWGRTRRVEMGAFRTVGFVGRCTYRLLDPSPELRRLLGLLADFAFYAGVGWQTTHGLGQVRPEIPAA